MNKQIQEGKHPPKRLSVWALIGIDLLATCLALGIFALFFFGLPWLEARHAEPTVIHPTAEESVLVVGPEPAQEEVPMAEANAESEGVYGLRAEAEKEPEAVTGARAEPEAESGQEAESEPESEPVLITEAESEPEPEPMDDWKFASLTTEEPVMTESGYTSHDICIRISSYDSGEGVIDSPYTVADIYVRDIRCLQSYFAGAKYIPTGHGEDILTLMDESGAIVAANGDYYSMQMGSGVLRNGILYRYPKADFDVCVLYYDGTMTIYPAKTIRTQQDWEKAFENAWQVWSFGPSLLDDEGLAYTDLRSRIFPVVANRNPRTGLGYFEPGHYCLVVVDGRAGDSAPGASIEEFALIFESLGCRQAYNLDGGGTSRMAYRGEIITQPSQDRVLPDIILVAEYEGSFAQKEANDVKEAS